MNAFECVPRYPIKSYTETQYTLDGIEFFDVPASQQAFVRSIHLSGDSQIPLYLVYENGRLVFHKAECALKPDPELQSTSDFSGIGIKLSTEPDVLIQVSDQYKKELFDKGVRACFDYIRNKAANNWHQNPAIQKVCDQENELLCELADDLLIELSPDQMATWKTITDLLQEVADLKSKLGVVNEPHKMP